MASSPPPFARIRTQLAFQSGDTNDGRFDIGIGSGGGSHAQDALPLRIVVREWVAATHSGVGDGYSSASASASHAVDVRGLQHDADIDLDSIDTWSNVWMNGDDDDSDNMFESGGGEGSRSDADRAQIFAPSSLSSSSHASLAAPASSLNQTRHRHRTAEADFVYEQSTECAFELKERSAFHTDATVMMPTIAGSSASSSLSQSTLPLPVSGGSKV